VYGIVRICYNNIPSGITLSIFEKFYISTASLLYSISVKIFFSRGVSSSSTIILASRLGVNLNPRVIFKNFGVNYCPKYLLYNYTDLFFNSAFFFHDFVFPGVDLSI